MLKLPKSYLADGRKFRVKKSTTRSPEGAGWFDGFEAEIGIDTKILPTDWDRLEVLIHEFMECSMAENGYRYKNNLGDYQFVLTHSDLRRIGGELARGIYDTMRANGVKTEP